MVVKKVGSDPDKPTNHIHHMAAEDYDAVVDQDLARMMRESPHMEQERRLYENFAIGPMGDVDVRPFVQPYVHGMGFLAYVQSKQSCSVPFVERTFEEQRSLAMLCMSDIGTGKHTPCPFNIPCEHLIDAKRLASIRMMIGEELKAAVKNAANVSDLDKVMHDMAFSGMSGVYRLVQGRTSMISYEFQRIKTAVRALAEGGMPVDMIASVIGAPAGPYEGPMDSLRIASLPC